MEKLTGHAPPGLGDDNEEDDDNHHRHGDIASRDGVNVELASFQLMDKHVLQFRKEERSVAVANPAVVPALPTLINLESAFAEKMNKVKTIYLCLIPVYLLL